MKIIISNNNKSFVNYKIISKIEAGISLTGYEVKSLRTITPNLYKSYILLNKNKEIWIMDFDIPCISYDTLNATHFLRPKKILLHKKEIYNISKLIRINNYAIIPKIIYWKHNWIKIELEISKRNFISNKLRSKKNLILD